MEERDGNLSEESNIVDQFATYADDNRLKRRNLTDSTLNKLLERYIISASSIT